MMTSLAKSFLALLPLGHLMFWCSTFVISSHKHNLKMLFSLFAAYLSTYYAVASGFQINFERTIDFSSEEGSIAVYDAAMPVWLTSVLQQIVSSADGWSYEYPDKLAGINTTEGNNFFWVSRLSPIYFMKSKPFIVFGKLAKNFTGFADYLPYEVIGTMLTRSDIPTAVPGSKDSDEIYFRIFLTEQFSTASDLIFSGKNGEILQAVKNRYNRIVVWNASLSYQYKPPDFDNFNREYSILIKMTKDQNKIKEKVQYIKALRSEEQKNAASEFPLAREEKQQFSKDFFQQHLKRKFYDKRGGVISFFDDILSEEELITLRKYLIKRKSAYSNADYMTNEDDDADNVSWLVMLTPESIITTKVLDIVKGIAQFLSGEDDWYPYDVSLNMIQNTFHTRIHEDCESYEFEYTFLLYLNPNWTENMYGETIFLNQIKDPITGKNGKLIQEKEYESIVAVRPKYGRIVMFRNNIPHSARPPSPDFHGTRYTFAVKVARTKLIALTKTLREILEFKMDGQDEGAMLYQKVSEMAQTWEFTMPAEEILGNITKYRNEKDSSVKTQRNEQISSLIRKTYVGKNEPTL